MLADIRLALRRGGPLAHAIRREFGGNMAAMGTANPSKEPQPVGSIDLSRANAITPPVQAAITEMFGYRAWTGEQEEVGRQVRDALGHAFGVIIASVPPGPDRSAAMRKLREARMDCNSAITFGGRY